MCYTQAGRLLNTASHLHAINCLLPRLLEQLGTRRKNSWLANINLLLGRPPHYRNQMMNSLYSHLKVAQRLSLAFALIMVISLVSLLFSIARLSQVGEATREMMSGPLKAERLVSDWNRNIAAGVRRTAAIARSSDPTLAAFFKEDQEEASKLSGELQKTLEPLMKLPQEQRIFQEIADVRKVFIGSRDAIVALKKEGKPEEALALMEEKFTPASKLYISKLSELLQNERDQVKAARC